MVNIDSFCILDVKHQLPIFTISASRFVKCERCHHFFVVIPENEPKKQLNVKEEKAKPKKRAPPPPKKVSCMKMIDKYITL